MIRFAREHRITLLVAEQGEADPRGTGREASAIRKIRHLINCPVEIVTPRRNLDPKEKGQ